MLANLLKWDLEQVLKGLYQLHKFQVVHYDPQKETPQVYFNQPRRKSADIRIDEKMYAFRKGQYVKRVHRNIGICKDNRLSQYGYRRIFRGEGCGKLRYM